MKALYDGEIYYHDKYLGDLLSHLEKTNLLNNTVVILTSDHGEEFYDHYGWGHIYSLFDELIHVPLIFYCPGFFPEGKRIKELFAHVDLLPTILSLCGISESFNPSYKIEGIDLSSLLLSQNHIKKREYVFSEVNISENLSASCLRSKEYKGIRVKRKQDIKNMFFDLKNDPLAKKNLYDEESSEVIELFDVLETVQKKAISKSFQAEKMQLDEKTKEKLKALGYIK